MPLCWLVQLCEMWHSSALNGSLPDRVRANARAIGFGMPCVLSLEAARACASRVTSVVCDDDFVSRSSVSSFHNLVRALTCLARCRVPRRGGGISNGAGAQLDYDTAVQACLAAITSASGKTAPPPSPSASSSSTSSSRTDNETQSLASHVLDLVSRIDAAAHPLWPSSDNVNELRTQLELIARAVVAFVCAHRESVSTSAAAGAAASAPASADTAASDAAASNAAAQEPLFPPGRCIWMRTPLAAAPPQPLTVDQLTFDTILLSTSMARSHLARNYVRACERAAAW